MSAHKDWGKNRRGEDLSKFLLTPLDAQGNPITDSAVVQGSSNHKDFEWNWYQHCPILMPNCNLLLFDNGDSRNFDSSNSNKYSCAVEYKIGEPKMQVQQKWSYGKERGLETFSRIVSSVSYLPETNHILLCPGFQVANLQAASGKMVEINYESKQVLFEMEISASSKNMFKNQIWCLLDSVKNNLN